MKCDIKHITMFNALTSLSLQIVTIISGFIIPRLILQTFGSEVNGLVSSINQFLNYISLLEGGVSSVIMANLYKPLIDKDMNKLSSVIKTSQKFFKKIAIIFLGYSIILAFIYPIIVKQNFSYEYIALLVLILAINIFIQYNFSLSWKLLLNADKKVYKVSLVQIGLVFVNTVTFVLCLKIYANIHFLKFISALVFILQPIIYCIIIKKQYNIEKNVKIDEDLIKDRWQGFGINVAAFIHYNTDITILTIFTNLKIVSIYSVYSLVTCGLRQLILAISSGIAPSLGQAYHKTDKKELNNVFEHYEFIITLITFFLFSVGGLLITPFITLYTKGINDANYYQPLFGSFILVSEVIYCIREPYVSLAYSAKRFKDITKHAYIESIINITISLVLVMKFKLVGVAIGTLIAMTYRTIYHIMYLQKNILHRPFTKFLKSFSIFIIFTIIGIVFCNYCLPIKNITIVNWVMQAIKYSCIFLVAYFIMTVLFFRDEFMYYKDIILKKDFTS